MRYAQVNEDGTVGATVWIERPDNEPVEIPSDASYVHLDDENSEVKPGFIYDPATETFVAPDAEA